MSISICFLRLGQVFVQFDPSRPFFVTLQGHCGKNVANQGPWIGTTKGEWTKGARIISSPSGTTKKKHKSLGGYWVSSYEQESSRQRKTTGDAGKVMAIFLCVFFVKMGLSIPIFWAFGVYLAGQTVLEHEDITPRVFHLQAPTPKGPSISKQLLVTRTFQNITQSLGRTLNLI